MRAPILLATTLLVLAVTGTLFFLRSDNVDGSAPITSESSSAALSPEGRDVATSATEELAGLSDVDESAIAAQREDIAVPKVKASEEKQASPAQITGRVLDPSGAGIGGALVEAGRDYGFGGFVVFSSDTEVKRERTETSTDSEGRFQLEGEWDGSVALKVLADGYAPFQRSTNTTAGSISRMGELTLERGVVLAGQILDHLGRPLADAKLHRSDVISDHSGMTIMRSGSSGEVVAETDADGRFEIQNQKVGPWKLLVTHEAHPDESAEGELPNAGDRDESILVQMREGYEIQGRVSGKPADAELSVGARIARKSDREMGGLMADLPRSSSRYADVQADGSFLLRGLEQGKSYELKAREQDRSRAFSRATRSTTVSARAGERGVELEYSVGTVLAFQVVDGSTGDPLTRFDVVAGIQFPMPMTDADGKRIKLHRNGEVRYEGLRPRSKNDRATLKVSAVGYEDYEQDGIMVPAGEEVPLGVIRLRPIPVVRVTVLDKLTNEPIEGASVRISQVEEVTSGSVSMRRTISIGAVDDDEGDIITTGDGEIRSGKTDASGVCVLSSIPGENVNIRVKQKGYAPVTSKEMTLPLVGDYEFEIQLRLGGTVAVTVLDNFGVPMAGQKVEHRAPQIEGAPRVMTMGAGSGGKRTDEEGKVVFDTLEEGMHGFKISDQQSSRGAMIFQSMSISGGEPDTSWEEILVSDGQTSSLTLVAPSRAELSGTITEAGQPLVDATLRLNEKGQTGGSPGMMMMGGGGVTAKTDGKGYFVFEDVKAADYDLSISHAARVMDASYELEIGEGNNDFDVDLTVTIVEGRVTDEQGQPIAGLRVTPERVEAGAPRRQMRMVMITTNDDDTETVISDGSAPSTEARTDADGYFQLRGVDADVDLKIKATGGDFEPGTSKVIHVPAGAVEGGVDIVMKQAGQLAVSITLGDGTPASGVMVSATFKGESDERVEPKFQFVQSGGETSFKGLKPGLWEVNARSIGDNENDGSTQEIEVVATETTEVSLTLP